MGGRAAGGALLGYFPDVRLGGKEDDAQEEDEGWDGSWGGADVLGSMRPEAPGQEAGPLCNGVPGRGLGDCPVFIPGLGRYG